MTTVRPGQRWRFLPMFCSVRTGAPAREFEILRAWTLETGVYGWQIKLSDGTVTDIGPHVFNVATLVSPEALN